MAKWGQVKLQRNIEFEDLRHMVLFLDSNVKLKNHVESFHELSNYGTQKAYNEMIGEYNEYIRRLKDLGVNFN